MKTAAKITAVLLVLALGAGNLGAETIIINITAEIDYIDDLDGLLNGQLIVGDIITGTYTYDSATPDSSLEPDYGEYWHYSPPYGINLSGGGFVFQTDPDNVEFLVGIENGLIGIQDTYGLRSYNNLPLYDNVHIGHISWQLDDSTGTALSSTALPTTAPVLEDWDDDWGIHIEGGIPDEEGKFIQSFYIQAPVISVELVPRPPATYYVNAADGNDNNDGLSKETAFATIQKAIDSALDGDTVIIAPGTYTGPGNWVIDFLGKAITIRSIDPNDPNIVSTTIITRYDHVYECLFHAPMFTFTNNEDANSVLTGFTIANPCDPAVYCQDSSPTISNCIIANENKIYTSEIACYASEITIENCIINGRIYCEDSSPTITNCSITESRLSGIHCINSNPIISNCTITSNTAPWGGGIYCEQSSPTITNCTITGNSARYGSGILCYKSSPTITNCTISGNSATTWGGGIACFDSSPTINNCMIIGNSTGGRHGNGGGISCWYSSPTINNCMIIGNSVKGDSAGGGGIYGRGRSLTITNCTISDNSAEWAGGGICCGRESNSTITNCILWGNEAPDGPQIYLDYPSNLWVRYSNVQGSWEDIGNIDADPCFVEPGYRDANHIWVEGDYHLLPDSPCIDTGDPNYIAEPNETDLDGNPRLLDGDEDGIPIVDMGAYEAMVSCFGVNHVKLGTKAGKKGNKVELKGTFDPASPIDFAVDDVTYTIDDGLGYMLTFIIPAGSFEPEGEPDKQKFRFNSAKGSQPGIKARFDFLKCKFELKVKEVMDTSEITAETLAIVLQAGANLVEEVVQVQAKPKHLEFKREPKLNCCQM